jgi:hypothetical protein
MQFRALQVTPPPTVSTGGQLELAGQQREDEDETTRVSTEPGVRTPVVDAAGGGWWSAAGGGRLVVLPVVRLPPGASMSREGGGF